MQIVDIPSEIGSLCNRIKRLIEYFPVIWRTWDFDSSTQYELLKYSIGRFQKYVKTNGHCVRTRRFDRDIKTMLHLLDTVNDEFEDQYDKQMNYVKTRHGVVDFKDLMIPNESNTHYRWHLFYYDKEGDIFEGEKLKAFRKDCVRVRDRYAKIKKEQHKMLFDLLHKRLPSMWD